MRNFGFSCLIMFKYENVFSSFLMRHNINVGDQNRIKNLFITSSNCSQKISFTKLETISLFTDLSTMNDEILRMYAVPISFLSKVPFYFLFLSVCLSVCMLAFILISLYHLSICLPVYFIPICVCMCVFL